MIKINNLKKSFGKKTVLKGIDLQVTQGEVMVIIGPSGSGKSTLLKHLIGLRRPTSGQVLFFGEDFTAAEASRRREMMRRFGVLYQSAALW